MIDADCLVFPAPSNKASKKIQRKLIYIPKRPQKTHYYHQLDMQDGLMSPFSTARTCETLNTPVSKGIKTYTNNFMSKKCYTHPKEFDQKQYIPCLLFNGKTNPQNIIIYFHSNAQDLINGYDFTRSISNYTGQTVLVVQYPGYSYYKPNQQSIKTQIQSESMKNKASKIEDDSIKVSQYLFKLGYIQQNITVMGRSIGSGPAVYLASLYKFRALILLSPFLSIYDAVRNKFGDICANLVKQRFNNKQRIQKIYCPALFIHGKQDKMIPFSHTIKLSEMVKAYSSVKIIQGMTHSKFRLYQDFMKHINSFYNLIK